MSLKKSENIGVNLVKLEILVDVEVFKKACENSYKKNCKRIRVPGFRVGKAPKSVIEKVYGKKIFYEDAINAVYVKDLDDAIKELNLDVVEVDNFDVVYVDEEKGLCFTVNCTLKPKVKVKNYKGIEVKKNVKDVTEEEINERIKALKERVSRIVNVEEERPCKEGDMVYLDFTGFVDGVSFRGGKAKNHQLVLGSSKFVDGFEQQVVGHKVNDEFDVEVVFDENYNVANLRGKKALFKCKLNSIKEIKFPEEDDEFAKDVSEFDSLEKLRDDIRNKIKKSHELEFERMLESRVLSEIVKNVSGDIPGVMFKNEYEELLKNFKKDVKRRGLTLEDYLDVSGIEEEDFRRDLLSKARFNVKINLALEEIAELEKLDVSEKEIEQEIKNIAKNYNLKVENVKYIFPDELIKKDILRRKTVDFVKKNAKIVEEPSKV